MYGKQVGNEMAEIKFPHIEKSIEDFLYSEEGNIPISKVLTIGSMMLILGIVLADADAFAAHRSHSSHQSHSSHSSGGGGGGHYSHSSHQSHSSSYGGSDTTTSKVATSSHSSHNNVAPAVSTVGAVHVVNAADSSDANNMMAPASIEDVGTPQSTTAPPFESEK